MKLRYNCPPPKGFSTIEDVSMGQNACPHEAKTHCERINGAHRVRILTTKISFLILRPPFVNVKEASPGGQ
jgi:hypothetical protein